MRKAVRAQTSRTASLGVASLALLSGTLGLLPGGPLRALGTPAATYKLSAAPVASFRWFPSSPRVGERFSLVSTSSDLTSPIVAFAWDVADNGPFGAFQRFLRAGVSLTVRVSKGTNIGAFTRFAVRRGKLPVRADSCLDPAGIKPIPCPSG